MGQYFIPIVQATKWTKHKVGEKQKFLRKVFPFSPYLFGGAAKFDENASKNEYMPKFIENLMCQLQKEGWKTQLVWAGDYGSLDMTTGQTLHDTYKEKTIDKVEIVSRDKEKNEVIVKVKGVKPFNMLAEHKFFINADKHEIVDAERCKESYHSVLALLTADSCVQGTTGEYSGEFWRYAGRWKGDVIYISDEPQHKSQVSMKFDDDWIQLQPIITKDE